MDGHDGPRHRAAGDADGSALQDKHVGGSGVGRRVVALVAVDAGRRAVLE